MHRYEVLQQMNLLLLNFTFFLGYEILQPLGELICDGTVEGWRKWMFSVLEDTVTWF